MRMTRSKWVSLVSLFVLAASVYVAATQGQEINDWWQLRGYQPSAEVAKLATDAGLSEDGKHVYYVAKPSIDSKTDFSQHCPVEETTIVLGCYSNQKIYVLKVSDPRLDGVEQVTAAHETLHAVYSRMSAKDKSRIDKLVEAAYAKQNNPALTKTVDIYRARDASTVDNELHSILGTEIRNLDPELEAHYAPYFKDRMIVVGLAEKYGGVFSKLDDQVTKYDAQLADIKKNIEATEPKVAAQYAEVETERKRLDALYAQKQYNQYNSAVPAFNAQVRAYNKAVSSLNGLIVSYNGLVKARNEVATVQSDLNDQLNATYNPVETQ